MDTSGLIIRAVLDVDAIYGVYLDAGRAFHLYKEEILRLREMTFTMFRQAGNPELASVDHWETPTLTYGKGDPSDADAVVLHRVTNKDLLSRSTKGGRTIGLWATC